MAETIKISKSDYLIENDLIFVKPYDFTFSAFAKSRWVNLPLISIYTREFGCMPPDYFVILNYFTLLFKSSKIKDGAIRVNNMSVAEDYLLCNNDRITHLMHRHEFPIL